MFVGPGVVSSGTRARRQPGSYCTHPRRPLSTWTNPARPPYLGRARALPPVLRAPARHQNIHSKDAKLLNLTNLEQFLKFKKFS